MLTKLDVFDEEVKARARLASLYKDKLGHLKNIITPFVEVHNKSVFAQYTVQLDNRESLQKKLQKVGIPSAVHYPIPLNLQPAVIDSSSQVPVSELLSKRVISLPMDPYKTEFEIDNVISQFQ